jgi:DNA polymerase-3 subunit delta'
MTIEPPHPREVFDYAGGVAAEAEFLSALSRGRLHHAWLLTGPQGGGKATFAYRAARRLLGAKPVSGPDSLDSDPADPVSRQIVSRSNPDLLVLQRDPEDGKSRKGIPVDEARGLPEFFSKSPARAEYRVAIVDAADDLNVNAANAVLKTLEEPPTRGVVLLVTQAPGALLATLRSRCRRLRIDPPAPEIARAWVAERAGVTETEAERLLVMARGAPGRAWRLAGEGALALDALAAQTVDRLPATDDAGLVALAESFRGAAGQARFGLFFDRLADRVHARAVESGSADLARAWSDLIDLPRHAEAVNLDRADVLFTAMSRLRAAA